LAAAVEQAIGFCLNWFHILTACCEKVQAEKRRLRDEMDKQIAEAAMKAAEAQAMTDKVISELAQAKAQNDEYQRAIQEIAALAATMTKTNEPTSLG